MTVGNCSVHLLTVNCESFANAQHHGHIALASMRSEWCFSIGHKQSQAVYITDITASSLPYRRHYWSVIVTVSTPPRGQICGSGGMIKATRVEVSWQK